MHFDDLILPKSILFLKNLKNLELIDFNSRTIPSMIFKIKSLESLKINAEFLQEFPEGILNLVNLVSLEISFTKIRTIPTLNPLSKLKYLNLEYNYLDQAPDVTNVPLETIDLTGNKIKRKMIF